MLKKKKSSDLFDNGWLASRWYMYINGFLDLGRWTNFKPIIGDIFEPTSFLNVGVTLLPNKTPTLAQRMIAVWAIPVLMIISNSTTVIAKIKEMPRSLFYVIPHYITMDYER